MNSTLSCWNCDGTGVEIFFPRVETLVVCDASKWILSPEIDSFIADCPYCKPPRDDSAAFFLLWNGPSY